MDGFNWLMAANAAVWLGIGAFVARLALIESRLARRLEHMEALRDD